MTSGRTSTSPVTVSAYELFPDVWVDLEAIVGGKRCVARVIFPEEARGALETLPLGARRIIDTLEQIGAAHVCDRVSRLDACGAGMVGAGPYAFHLTHEELKLGLERALFAPVTRPRVVAA